MANRIQLLAAAAATGSAVKVPAGVYQWLVWGSFNGQTATLECSPDDGSTWIGVGSDATATANKTIKVELGTCMVRVSFGGAPTSVSSDLRSIPR